MTVRELKEIVNNVNDKYLDSEVYFWMCDKDGSIRFDYSLFEARPTIGDKVVFDINLFYAEEDVGNYDATGIKWNYSENKE